MIKFRSALGAVSVVGAVVALGARVVAATDALPASSDGEGYTIVMVSGPLNDPFFSAMSSGAEDAGEEFGVDVEYLSPAEAGGGAPAYVALIENALAQNPDALAINNFAPDSFDPLIERATEAGIPVVSVNNGGEAFETNGSIAYVGQDEFEAGRAAGEAMAAAGATNGLCVMHYPGIPSLEARCAGFDEAMAEAGGATTSISMVAADANNASALTQNIAGSLQQDSSIDAVFTLGSQVAMSAVAAVDQAGSEAMVGTTDLSTPVLEAVQSGDIAFAIDQQPYLQSYQAVMSLVMELRYGVHPVGQVSTGPLLITQDNVDRVIEINEEHTGIRGAA